jgi:hypothetical protein
MICEYTYPKFSGSELSVKNNSTSSILVAPCETTKSTEIVFSLGPGLVSGPSLNRSLMGVVLSAIPLSDVLAMGFLKLPGVYFPVLNK